MPILIKGSGGGQQEAPVISVSSSGLITATAGDKSATKQLSSAYDADFIASNIKSGVSIFGVAGTMDNVKYYFGTSSGSGVWGSYDTIRWTSEFADFTSLSQLVGLALVPGWSAKNNYSPSCSLCWHPGDQCFYQVYNIAGEQQVIKVPVLSMSECCLTLDTANAQTVYGYDTYNGAMMNSYGQACGMACLIYKV